MITIKQMLEIGKECGLSDIEQAYSQVMTHYDVFFFGSKEQGKFMECTCKKKAAVESFSKSKCNITVNLKDVVEELDSQTSISVTDRYKLLTLLVNLSK